MNFDDLTFDELDEQAMSRLVFDEEDMSPILKGHIFIEKILETLVSKHLKRPQAIFKRTRSFEFKADLALAMGLIEEKCYSAFMAINAVRRNYAHQDDYHLSVKELSGFKLNWAASQNKAFEVACSKSTTEAARIATIFLCWFAIRQLKTPDA